MLQKKKITRKRNREWRTFFRKILIFIVIFAGTLGLLLVISRQPVTGLLSPLSFAKDVSLDKVVIQDTAEVRKALKEKEIEFDDVKISSDGAYMIKLTTGEDLILSPKKDLDKQLSSLQVIYSRLTMEGRGLKRLDFRYDKPIVVFK